MITPRYSRSTGFALIEALIALLLISIGLLAVSKLQTASILGAGDGRARADAANLSQRKIEELRNSLFQKSDFTALADGDYGPEKVLADPTLGRVSEYELRWKVSTPDGSLEKRRVFLSTTWTDAKGNLQRLDMNTEFAYDEPYIVATVGSSNNKNLISPNGEAVRGGNMPPGLSPVVSNHDGSKIYFDPASKATYLVKPGSTTPVIYLPPKNNLAQSFTRISGRVYFDPQGGNKMPPANEVLVRLSSEGECIYDNTKIETHLVLTTYKYLSYTCYVGPGWYGNVGVTVVDSPGNPNQHNVCGGDPGFGAKIPKQTSAHADFSASRVYRGFRNTATTSGFQSTGMAGGRYYGTSFAANGTEMTGPFDGRPRPSDDPAIYGAITPGSAGDYLNQDFLITDKIKSNFFCGDVMQGGPFARNAGAFVCINPDAHGAVGDQSGGFADVCPVDWPGYGSSGSGNTGTCSPAITGKKIDGFGTVNVSASDGNVYGACPGQGNSANITCTFNAVPDDTVTFTLTNVPHPTKSTAANYVGLQPLVFTLDCQALPPALVFQIP